jgi:5S rRNA maturation endonuclease (ribonuclease M5)
MDSREVEELLAILRENVERQVIVEGKRDKEVLCSLGFKKVLTISNGIYETTELLADRDVLILTDFDREGREIARKLERILQPIGFRVDIVTRKRIGHMLGKLKILEIEHLRSVLYE